VARTQGIRGFLHLAGQGRGGVHCPRGRCPGAVRGLSGRFCREIRMLRWEAGSGCGGKCGFRGRWAQMGVVADKERLLDAKDLLRGRRLFAIGAGLTAVDDPLPGSLRQAGAQRSQIIPARRGSKSKALRSYSSPSRGWSLTACAPDGLIRMRQLWRSTGVASSNARHVSTARLAP